MTSNEKSILQAALDKLPDQRHQLMYSEAGSLKDEIERLQKELQGVRLGAEGMGWAPRSHVDGAYERGFAEGSGNEGYYQRTIRQLKEAIYWALGERGEFGAEPEPLAGKYRRAFWWRTELRKRSGLPISGQSSPVETSQPLVSWRLTDEHINSLQVASVDRLIKRAKAAHYVNVRVRINGDWEEHEADWIKHMKREGLTAPSPAPRDQLLRDAIDMCEGWSAHVGGIGQDTIAALREWLSELSAPTHAIGLPAGELTAEMLQIMKDNSDQIEQMRPEEPSEPPLPAGWVEHSRHGEYVEGRRGNESAMFHLHMLHRPPTVHYCTWVGRDVQCDACGNGTRLPENGTGDV